MKPETWKIAEACMLALQALSGVFTIDDEVQHDLVVTMVDIFFASPQAGVHELAARGATCFMQRFEPTATAH